MKHPLAIYVSGPYTSDPEANTDRAVDIGQVLLRAGHAPFVPHLSHYWEKFHHPNDYEFWIQIDLEWVRRADVVVRIPGVSAGADREVALAQTLGIPVFEWGGAFFLDTNASGDERILLAFLAFVEENGICADETSVVPPAIDEALKRMRAIFETKNADYAEGTWDSNFLDVARQMGFDRETACDTFIAVKQARLRSLRTSGKLPSNEAVADTVLDRAVYALIALAMHSENGAFE